MPRRCAMHIGVQSGLIRLYQCPCEAVEDNCLDSSLSGWLCRHHLKYINHSIEIRAKKDGNVRHNNSLSDDSGSPRVH